ncbi:hypothetical protein PAMC26577_35765 [Caballeronia sordidicola]|uniref:Uncharacterized protein n=1 Tax=Caballeronia sordidicola TaxID=196367 RepID=A0A242M9A5_CABSO|nr:hypothetical protein PAMC26577_35765 [Caballeronia sordidicola]
MFIDRRLAVVWLSRDLRTTLIDSKHTLIDDIALDDVK